MKQKIKNQRHLSYQFLQKIKKNCHSIIDYFDLNKRSTRDEKVKKVAAELEANGNALETIKKIKQELADKKTEQENINKARGFLSKMLHNITNYFDLNKRSKWYENFINAVEAEIIKNKKV